MVEMQSERDGNNRFGEDNIVINDGGHQNDLNECQMEGMLEGFMVNNIHNYYKKLKILSRDKACLKRYV